MRKASFKTLILGIGNLLLGDEGLGVHAVRELQRVRRHLPNVEIMEVGTAILEALPALEKADKVILLDALQVEGEPGSVYRVSLDQCSKSPCVVSMHGFDIFRVLALAQRQELPEVIVLGIKPAHIGWSTELSDQVVGALPILFSAVYQEIEQINRCVGF